ncbi:MAG TPA: FecR domain-containing protein [Polyangiaceae bacterium]|nr:FecR domain-containing protein [Polyangiaceae bacterium]
MDSQKAGLTEVASKIQDALAAETHPSEQIRIARTRLLREVTTGQLARNSRGSSASVPRLGLWWVGAASGVAAIAAVLGWVLLRERPISFEIGAHPTTGQLGDVVQANNGQAVPVRFSDGSSVVLAKEGRMRVLAADPSGARVLLEQGEVDVSVTHRAGKQTRWNFEAGPFQVHVIGTEFAMAWNPSLSKFSLRTRAGSVRVLGPCLDGPPGLQGSRAVDAGARLEVNCPEAAPAERSDKFSLNTPAPGTAASAWSVDPGQASTLVRGRELEQVGTSPEAQHPAVAPTSSLNSEPNWREALRSGRGADALRIAESSSFPAVCERATRSELLELADAARLSAKSQLATTALLALRKRFSGSTDAATAAFALGRIAFEQQHDYSRAARWFKAYMDELPGGPLIGDAAGRLMEAKIRQGDRAGARLEAERYLKRFPQGPYAAQARRISSE